MSKNSLTLFLILFLMVSNAYGAKVDVVAYAQSYLQNHNLHYLIDESFLKKEFVDIKEETSQEKKEDLAFISRLLQEKNFLLQYDRDLKLYYIIHTRDVRYNTDTPILYHENELDNYEGSFVNFLYTIKHLKGKRALQRALRPFMSRYGRINVVGEDHLLLQDTSETVKRLLMLLQNNDTKEVQVVLDKKIKENLPKDSSSFVSLQGRIEILILILFCLVSAIVGFLFRGFLIRRFEGGL